MIRNVILAILLIAAVIGGLAGVKALQIKSMIAAGAAFAMPPETVTVAPVQGETWQGVVPAVGTMSAVQGITLRAEVAGTVKEIRFESGDNARESQVLVQLDVDSEEAQLRSAEAQAELARLNLDRSRGLREKSTISQSEFDSASANFQQSIGQADMMRAAIDKKTIRAPFAGRLGIRRVNVGQFVNAGDPLVSLHTLDPIYVDFNLPEQRLSSLSRNLTVRITTDAIPDRAFDGVLTALDPNIDPATRNVRIQATLPNPDGMLRPGMFARVEVVLPTKRGVQTIPATAVLHAPYGDSVFVVEETKDAKTGNVTLQARMTTVRVGETRGDFIEITRGLEPGQQVVTSGVFKLRNETPLVIDNKLAPNAVANPQPADS